MKKRGACSTRGGDEEEGDLFHKAEFFPLGLPQAIFNTVRLAQALQGEEEEFCVVFVRERWEGYVTEPARFEPVHGCSVDSNGFLGGNIWTILWAGSGMMG